MRTNVLLQTWARAPFKRLLPKVGALSWVDLKTLERTLTPLLGEHGHSFTTPQYYAITHNWNIVKSAAHSWPA